MAADVADDVAADVGDDVGHDVMMTSSLTRLRPDPTDPDFNPTRVNDPTRTLTLPGQRSTTRPGQRSTPDPVNITQQLVHALPRAATRAEPSGGA